MLDRLLSEVDKQARETLRDVDRDCNCLSASVDPEDHCDTIPSDIEDTDTSDLEGLL